MNKKYSLIMILISLLCTIFASYKLIYWKNSITENSNIEKEINSINNVNYDTLLNYLIEYNEDTVGYLKVNNTRINNVVVQSNDNKYYLTHNFMKKGNSAGWLFADFHNKIDESDKNLIIYGHNMKNGSMFGTLKNTMQSAWYKNPSNQTITFATLEGIFTYQVFSIYSIPVEDYYITTNFKNDDEFNIFINTLKGRSIYNFDVTLNKNDKILTLSTCNSGGKNRTVLHAKLVKIDK